MMITAKVAFIVFALALANTYVEGESRNAVCNSISHVSGELLQPYGNTIKYDFKTKLI